MSIPVELPDLAQAIARYRFAYLLTGSDQGAPHAVAVVPVLQGGMLIVNKVGRRTRENLLARPAVGLVWPPQSEAEYSLIVDGQAALDGESARITPARAVLHRPARRPRVDPAANPAVQGDPAANPAAQGDPAAGPAAQQGTCVSDCVELAVPAAVGSIIHKGGV